MDRHPEHGDAGIRDLEPVCCRRRSSIPRNLLVVLGLTPALVACGGGGATGSGAAESRRGVGAPPIIAPAAVPGRYVGSVTIDGVSYFGDALFTTDGEVRLYVGGPYDCCGGALQEVRPDSSMQFVGIVSAVTSDKASGHGVIIGQGCSDPNQVRFCGTAASADVNVGTQDPLHGTHLQGQIQLGSGELWSLDLDPWDIDNTYYQPAGPADLKGQYLELNAEFATGDDTIVSVDSGGALSFQSLHSGCLGAGQLTPHLNEWAYDVSLKVESCSGAYAYLNGSFTGLAVSTSGGLCIACRTDPSRAATVTNVGWQADSGLPARVV
jgi:hypothetical protein